MKYLGIALLTLATVAAGLPATASEPLAPDVTFRLGSALLAGDPIDADLLTAATAREAETVLTEKGAQQQTATAHGNDQTFSPYFTTAAPTDDLADDATYRLVAGVGCALDKKTTLDVALGGTLAAEDGMQEAIMGALGADFDDHSISLGVTMTF